MAAIFRREFAAYFKTPLGYAFLAVYLLFSGVFFFLFNLGGGVSDMTQVFTTVAVVLICVMPILTMRLMAEDRRQKTDQLLLTAPVSLGGIVGGKFLAAFAVFALGCCIFIVDGIVLMQFGEMAWRPVIGNIAGLLALGMIFISVGIFISSLTENQMIAAILSILVNFAFLLGSTVLSYFPETVQRFLQKLSVFDRYNELALGIFKPGTIIFFVSFAFVFLFLTTRVLESRRWR